LCGDSRESSGGGNSLELEKALILTLPKTGRVKMESADNGTLFLDEIGTLPSSIQAKLLRVLQSRVISPLGTNDTVPLTARIVAATNLDLKTSS
jgi:transcriptional regulator with GAF, ATPase, and Fis domain